MREKAHRKWADLKLEHHNSPDHTKYADLQTAFCSRVERVFKQNDDFTCMLNVFNQPSAENDKTRAKCKQTNKWNRSKSGFSFAFIFNVGSQKSKCIIVLLYRLHVYQP